MILISVPQTMEEKTREVAKVPDHCRFWDIDDLRVFFCTGKSMLRIHAMIDAGIAHNFAVFTDMREVRSPRYRGHVRYDNDGLATTWSVSYDATEHGLWQMRLANNCDLNAEYKEYLIWVLMGQQSWNDQEHNGNMYLMRKMLLQ